MKILTDFHDYYDMTSMDHSVLYLRKRIKHPWSKVPLVFKNLHRYNQVLLIGFCGEIYPLYRYTQLKQFEETLILKSYNLEDLPFEDWILKSLKKFKEEIKYLNISNIFIEYETPIFVIDYVNSHFIINPRLKDYGFQTIFDPVQAYQEIEMYIGNILLPKDKESTPLTDKEKIISKGFDLKTSFRKDKNESTRKNK